MSQTHPQIAENENALPDLRVLAKARSSIIRSLPSSGLGLQHAEKHLQEDIVPGLTRSSKSARYYGFVTGGATPAAQFADNLVTEHDQNLSVHLPNEGIATDVEDAALRMVCELVYLNPQEWPHRIFTTGATASNILGLACGREYVVAVASKEKNVSVSELGIVGALLVTGLDEVQILSTMPHSSLIKAASVLGFGRASVRDIGRKDEPLRFDFNALEIALARGRMASIVSVSCAEINTGLFATGSDDMRRLRQLCDQYGAWLHVDAAFGLQARALMGQPGIWDGIVLDGVRGLDLADSITGDAHKMLNVPYDCGIFFSKHLSNAIEVFQNTNAAYLKSGSSGADMIPSPLNIGLENSRRFRALPVYSTLLAYGRDFYVRILKSQIQLAQEIARYVHESEALELLPAATDETWEKDVSARVRERYMVVLFRARNQNLNAQLVGRVNAQRRIYISGTTWEGRPAGRFAVANWQVDPQRDIEAVRQVLEKAVGQPNDSFTSWQALLDYNEAVLDFVNAQKRRKTEQ